MSEVKETKKCPFCGGEININAVKCKHCKKFIKDDTKNNLKLFVVVFFTLVCFIVLITVLFKFENSKDNSKNESFVSTNIPENKNEIPQIKEYNKIFDDVERYQAKYWEIIKRHDILLQVAEFDDYYYNDLAELNALFVVMEDKINYNNKYLTQLREVDEKYKNNNGETQYEMNMNAGAYNEAVDAVLNELYQDIRKTIPAIDFEKLKQSEIKWLKDIKDYEKVYYSEDRGSMGGMTYANMLANMRKFRTLLLIPYLD